ncbi:serine/threonine-protein kinase [Wenzhouxiangella marina]|uniref:Protein kinase domain-containing protein n=1 Tax=Wenzhouxiangella marina TaxID=1579979 RepID=A0A0K0XU49_9GAMM|nr:serine/threonine-protein kinase [Wenzhouxiangella marina]AKS41224.1 hypothetical protein WM2015_843 [Wenzhouxiangella marina]MBB6088104.1 serine/threonine protein kinase [Wenzhouxiangella marina]
MSDAKAFRRLETLFHEVEALGPEARKQRLSELAQTDPELHAQLTTLLGGTQAGGAQLLDDLAESSGALLAEPAAMPERIGPYRLRGELGRGGMGVVYEAEQTEPMQRRVALKLARTGFLSEAGRARFLAERQALAVLDHPNIAKVFDAGSTASGQLWFAMELVRGQPITQWVADRGLSLEQRIELFLPVCEAIQHAHQKGLIHRDIKPSNLLVVDQDGRGQVRVIDFGIAKALESADHASSGATRVGEAVGTPEYMSPEQASLGEVDIDTRSDVYALGLVLYELLTGRLPIDPDTVDDASFGELCRRVREDPVPPPSRVALAGPSAIERSALRGDLDRVVLKALAQDRERRYPSASALADDLRRVLACQPVMAAPPTLAYRVGRFLRRHRLPVSLAALAGLALISLTALTYWQAGIAASERDRARIEAQRSEAVVRFLQDMLASVDPAQAQGRDPTVRELLDRTRSSLPEAGLDLQARAAVEETLATTYVSLGEPESGLPLAQAASARLREALGPEHPLTLSAQHAEARFYLYLGHYDQAADLLETTLVGRERVLGVHMDTASTMHNLAYAYAEQGDIERALALDYRQLELVEQLSGPGSEEALVTMSSVAHGLTMLERFEEAVEMFERILEGYRQHLGARHPNTLSVLHNLAYLTRAMGDSEAAEQRYREVIALRREVLGSEHLQTLNSIANLGALLIEQNRPEDARPLIEESLRTRRSILEEGHPDVLASRLDALRLRWLDGRSEGLAEELRALDEQISAVMGNDSDLARLSASFAEQLSARQAR